MKKSTKTSTIRSKVPKAIYANSNKPREAVAELELFAQLDPKSAHMEARAAPRARGPASAPQLLLHLNLAE